MSSANPNNEDMKDAIRADVNAALYACKQACALSMNDAIDKPIYHFNLGGMLEQLFEMDRDIERLDEAVNACIEA